MYFDLVATSFAQRFITYVDKLDTIKLGDTQLSSRLLFPTNQRSNGFLLSSLHRPLIAAVLNTFSTAVHSNHGPNVVIRLLPLALIQPTLHHWGNDQTMMRMLICGPMHVLARVSWSPGSVNRLLVIPSNSTRSCCIGDLHETQCLRLEVLGGIAYCMVLGVLGRGLLG